MVSGNSSVRARCGFFRVGRLQSRGLSGHGAWLQAKLDRLYDNGVLRKGDIDSYTMDALTALTSDLADCAMNRFCEANFSRITNKSGFLMGIIRRVQVEGPSSSFSGWHSFPLEGFAYCKTLELRSRESVQ